MEVHCAPPMYADHPRVCGENLFRSFEFGQVPGSPPRMRGKPKENMRQAEISRITPAYAGKTLMRGCKKRLTTDHPRVCGENGGEQNGDPADDGSPPRMRGKQLNPALPAACVRITPAYAGKTVKLCTFFFAPTDHPRVCGENFTACPSRVSCQGSPPRMRGKRLFCRRA